MNWGRIRRWLYNMASTIFITCAALLVAYDLLRGIEWQLPAFVERLIARQADIQSEATRDEIQKYVLFTDVTYGRYVVVTGTEFASDLSRNITKQWCYMSGSQVAGNSISRLSLANKNNAGDVTNSPISPQALAEFDLTRTSARTLVNSHCRFQ